MTNNEQIVIDSLKTSENRKFSEELKKFYHPYIEQIEFPNAVTKNKTIRNFNDSKNVP